jgi:hypothetical protein
MGGRDRTVSGAELVGVDRLHRTIGAAQDRLYDLADPASDTGRVVAAAGASAAPRHTGQLAGSARVVAGPGHVTITFTAPYAAIIEWGWRARGIRPQPYAGIAAQRTESTWIKFYETAVGTIVDSIEGA